MGIKLVQQADVRKYARVSASDTTTTNDVIDYIIEGVSEVFQKISGRGCDQVSRTEYFDVDQSTREIYLGAWPLASTPVITIYQDTDRNFAAASAIDSTNYFLDSDRGIVILEIRYPVSKRSIKVTYTGGAAEITSPDSGSEFWTLYPDAANAILQQCVYEYRNLKMLGKGEIIVSDSHAKSHGPVRLLPLFKTVARMFGRGPSWQ